MLDTVKASSKNLVLVLGIVMTALETLGIGIGVIKWHCSGLLPSSHWFETRKTEINYVYINAGLMSSQGGDKIDNQTHSGKGK